MEIIKYITYLSSIVWLFIPIRQYKTRFFLFFLLLALYDPVFISAYYLFKVDISVLYLLGSCLLLYAVLFNIKAKTKYIITIFIFIVITIVAFYIPTKVVIVQLIIHLLIFFSFLKIFTISYSDTRKLSVFFLILLSYEFSLLLKFFIYLTEFEMGMMYFHLTTVFQILIGLFFLFINEKNSPLIKV